MSAAVEEDEFADCGEELGYVDRGDFERFADALRSTFRERDQSHFDVLLDRFQKECGL